MNTIKINRNNTKIIAHRGLSGIERENTNSAFVAAGNRSYYGIETDIYKTADGNFVVNHDGNLERIAGVNLNVENATMSELENIILFDVDNTKNRNDLRICTLENYISICKKYDKHCVLELKSKFSDEEINKIINIYKFYDYLDNVTFISFDYDNLMKIRNKLPSQSIQYLFCEINDDIINKLINGHFDVDIEYKHLTKDNVDYFHKLGIKVNCWTVNSKEDAERLIEIGVDYITTNILE